MIGLATRAGKTVAGEFAVEKSVKTGKAYMVIVSTQASDNTKKLFRNKCEYYQIPYYEYGTREELGLATGNKDRVSIAILDFNFSETIGKLIKEGK